MTLSESQIIQRIAAAAGAPRSDVVLGIGDDAAVLAPPAGMHLVAALDTLVAGRHFPVDMDPQAIGYRALAVNLSDLAAMAATPAWALVSLAVDTADAAWVDAFGRGIAGLAILHQVAIVGGDTVGGPLSVTVQLLGFCAPGTMLTRGGGRPGDKLYVSGTPGDAAAGLAVVNGELRAEPSAQSVLRERFERPQPRVALGRALAGIATAAIDVSDGLVPDAGHIAAASGCRVDIDANRLPFSKALLDSVDADRATSLALAGGDDYELMFAAPGAAADQLALLDERIGVRLTCIGRLADGHGVQCLRDGGSFDPPPPFRHFQAQS